jgi:DNA primase
LSRNIVLALDADAAGQGATVRSLEMLPDALETELQSVDVGRQSGARTMILAQRRFKAKISIVRLPEGKDPDELIRRDPGSWPGVVAEARPLLEFYVDSVLAGTDVTDAEAKSQALERILGLLRFEPDRSVQEHYVNTIARRLQYRVDYVARRLKSGSIVAVDADQRRASPEIVQRSAHEDHLLALLLRHRVICQGVLPLVLPEHLDDPRNREILRVLQDESVPLDMAPEAIVAVLDDLVADHAEALLERLEQTPLRYPAQIERDAREALRRLERERYDALLSGIQSSIAAAEETGEAEEVSELRHRLAELSQRHRQFYPPRSPYFRDSRDNDRVPAVSGR